MTQLAPRWAVPICWGCGMCELTQAVFSFVKIKLHFSVNHLGDRQMLLMKLQRCVSDRQGVSLSSNPAIGNAGKA